MNSFEKFSQFCDYSKQSIASVQSIIENCKTVKNKILTFLDSRTDVRSSESSNLLSVALTDITTNRTYITWVSPVTYNNALEDEDGTSVLSFNTVGDEITVNNGEIVEAVENLVQEATLQEEFLSAILSNEEVTKESFISTISNKYHAITGAMIDKYTQLLNSDAFSALSNFIGLINTNSVAIANDEYIEVVDKSMYFDGPNVFLTAVTQIVNTVADFFREAFERFTTIKNFIRKLWDSIVSFGKYLIKKLYSQLVTVYEKADVKYGVIDVPIIQFPIGKLTRQEVDGKIKYSWVHHDIGDNVADNPCYAINQLMIRATGSSPGGTTGFGQYGSTSYRHNSIQITDIIGEVLVGPATLFSALNTYQPVKSAYIAAQMCCYNIIQTDDDGNEYLLPYDVIIPSKDVTGELQEMISGSPGYFDACKDLVVRIAATSDFTVTLGVYVATSYSELEALNDKQIADAIKRSCIAAHFNMLKAYPIMPVHQTEELDYFLKHGSVSDDLYRYNIIQQGASIIFDDTDWVSAPDENFNLVARCKAVTTNLNNEITSICDNGYGSTWPGFQTYSTGLFFTELLLSGALLGPINSSHRLYTQSYWYAQELTISAQRFLNTLVYMSYDTELTDYPDGWTETTAPAQYITVAQLEAIYRPYVKYALIGNSIHVQTYQERVNEVKAIIISTIVAIAATVITIKVLKFRNNRLKLQQLREAQLDTYMFNMMDPSSEVQCSYEGYSKLRRKVKRTNRINSLLGFNSSESVSASADGSAGLMAAIKSLANGSTSSEDTITLLDIKRLIR